MAINQCPVSCDTRIDTLAQNWRNIFLSKKKKKIEQFSQFFLCFIPEELDRKYWPKFQYLMNKIRRSEQISLLLEVPINT